MTNFGEILLSAIKKEIDKLQYEFRFDFDGRQHWEDVLSEWECIKVMDLEYEDYEEYKECEAKYVYLNDLYYA